MSVSAEARARLAAAQAELALALTAGGDPPAGFDAGRFQAAAAALARKRARAVAQAWPELAAALGPRFDRLFADYSTEHALPREGGPTADGRGFAAWLAQRGKLPEPARLEALAVDLRYRWTRDGLQRRKWPSCRITRLANPRRLVIAVRLPEAGELWMSVPPLLPRAARQP